MHKVLALVLSVSILTSSITPALGQIFPAGRGTGNFRKVAAQAGKSPLMSRLSTALSRRVLRRSTPQTNWVQNRISKGDTNGLARLILQEPATLRAPILRNEFVSLSLIPGAVTSTQQAQAVRVYQAQLKDAKKILSTPTDYDAFIRHAKENPTSADVTTVRNLLADASALGLVGTKEDATSLLDFCEQAQETKFDRVAVVIAAHGLLRMQAYDELQTLMTKYDQGGNILDGVKDYIDHHKIPVTYTPRMPHETGDNSMAHTIWVEKPLADFLSQDSFSYNRLHADFTEQATEQWVNLRAPVAAVPYEEPGLHVSNVRPVYVATAVPEQAQIGGDLVGADDKEVVAIGADGVKLTLEGENKVEHILHNVDLTVSNTLKHFSPEYNRLALDTNYIFELRNQKIPAKRPDHFYFALSTQDGELNTLLEGARQLNMSRPMRIKIQRSSAPKKNVSLPVFDTNLQEPPVIIAEVDVSLLNGIKNPEKGHIWAYNNNIYFRTSEGEITELENAFVRLPKTESKYWTQILALYPQRSFNLGVFSTSEKMVPLTYLVPSLQIGLGKTLAPVLNDMSSLGETTSSAIMLGINNVLPALMGLVHPFLKQYGEAAVFRVGASMFAAGGLIALASGLYGHVGGSLSNLQLAGFLTSSVLIALGTNITRFVQNLLMSANRGIVPQANSFQKKEISEGVQMVPQTYNARFFLRRGYEVLTKKSSKSLRDIVFYQRGAMFKNLGTMLFLAFPWLANMVGKSFGYDLGLDFSASYVPYSLYSLYTLRQVMKTRYKDAFPLNKTVLQNNLQDVAQAATRNTHKIDPAEISAEHPVVIQAAKKIKTAIDALTPVEARQTKTTINILTDRHEKEVGKELENLLALSEKYTPQQAATAREALQQAFDNLGHRNVKLVDVMRMVGLPASLSAMTLATLGELGLSNGLAFAMRELIGNGTAATGIVGLLLYGCMFGWRIVGNVLSQRMSGGSMYAISSMASIGGPLLMTAAGNNIGLLATGAMIACFGVSNFFSQMYEYMVGLHPKYKREIALLINYTMPLAAVPAALLREIVNISGIPSLDIGISGAALAASVALTPGMLANSSMVQGLKYGWQRLKANLSRFFNRRGNIPPAAQTPAN